MKKQMLEVAESRRNVYNLLAELFLIPIPTPGAEYVQKFAQAIDNLPDLPGPGDYGEGVRLLRNFKAVVECGNNYTPY